MTVTDDGEVEGTVTVTDDGEVEGTVTMTDDGEEEGDRRRDSLARGCVVLTLDEEWKRERRKPQWSFRIFIS